MQSNYKDNVFKIQAIQIHFCLATIADLDNYLKNWQYVQIYVHVGSTDD